MKVYLVLMVILLLSVSAYGAESCREITDYKSAYIYNYYPTDSVSFRFRSQEKPKGKFLYTQSYSCYGEFFNKDTMKYCEIDLPPIFEHICVNGNAFLRLKEAK